MAGSGSDTPNLGTEKTFKAYSHEQGKAYSQSRPDYHPTVYATVIQGHTSTGGQLDTLLDIGCGPGNVARRLAPHFRQAVGLDPSEGMISTARSLGGVTSTTDPIQFEVSTAEELGRNLSPSVQDASVDLITAGNAAHWFNLTGFWTAAARVLKPGGSVALWTTGDIRVHPSMPNAVAIQAALDSHEERRLKPYLELGNVLVKNRYKDLPLPWTLPKPIIEFDESTFIRKDWTFEQQFLVADTDVDLNTFEKILSTGSVVTRWRQAHPEAVGTDGDVTKILLREVEHLLHEAGVEKGHERLKGVALGTVLIVKKKG